MRLFGKEPDAATGQNPHRGQAFQRMKLISRTLAEIARWVLSLLQNVPVATMIFPRALPSYG